MKHSVEEIIKKALADLSTMPKLHMYQEETIRTVKFYCRTEEGEIFKYSYDVKFKSVRVEESYDWEFLEIVDYSIILMQNLGS